MKKLTFKEVRKNFWLYIASEEEKKEFRTRKKQNDYNPTIRTKFCNYVDCLCKNGEITEKQYERIAL